MPTLYGYVRGSKDEQEQTLTVQQEAIRREYDHRFAGSHAWGGCLVDRGVSGKIPLGNRPRGVTLLVSVEPGDVVVITKLDRGFRNLEDLVGTMRRWQEKGVRLVLLDLNIDTGTPVGKLMAHLLGAVAEFERDRISERVREVIRSRKARGLSCGGPAPYGFRWVGADGKKRFAKDPYTRAIGVKIIEWHDRGWSWYQIARHLLYERVLTRRGQEWSPDCCRRTYDRERRLQRKEALALEKENG